MKGEAVEKKKRNLLIVLLVAVAVVFMVVLNGSDEELSEDLLAPAIPRSFSIEVSAIGVLDAARSHMLSSEIVGDEGKIINLVEDGKHVKEGDLLVKLDPAPFAEKVQQLESEVKALESEVAAYEQVLAWEKNQVEKDIKTAEFNVKVAKLDYERLAKGEGPLQMDQYTADAAKAKEEYERYVAFRDDLKALMERGYANLSEIDQADKKIKELKEKYSTAGNKLANFRDHVLPSLQKTAEAKVEKSEMDLIQTQKGGAFKIAKAIADLQEAKDRLQSKSTTLGLARSKYEKTEIFAPTDGIAILYETFRDGEKRKPRVGDRVTRSQPILYLPDISSMVVKTQIREVDLHKISLEQKAVIQVDAYPSLRLEGRVSFIGALASEMRVSGLGGKYFQLTVRNTSNDERLRPGMTARVTIVTDQVHDALSVPVAAVFQEKDALFCFKHTRGKFKHIRIQAGRQSTDFIEIISGLTEGDKVSLVLPSEKNIIGVDAGKVDIFG